MKITTQNSLINTNVFSNIQRKDEQSSFLDKAQEDISVKVTLSDKGMEAYRKNMQEMNPQNGTADLEALETMRKYGDKMVIDPANGMEAEFHKRLLELNSGVEESIEAGAKNCLTVYAEMYDEIKKGYEQGTREYWVLEGDASKEDDWRKVTEEEELAALDKAFDFYSYVLDSYAKYGIKAGEDAQRAILNTQYQLEEQSEPVTGQRDETEDIYRKMKMAKKIVDEQYASKTMSEVVRAAFVFFDKFN